MRLDSDRFASASSLAPTPFSDEGGHVVVPDRGSRCQSHRSVRLSTSRDEASHAAFPQQGGDIAVADSGAGTQRHDLLGERVMLRRRGHRLQSWHRIAAQMRTGALGQEAAKREAGWCGPRRNPFVVGEASAAPGQPRSYSTVGPPACWSTARPPGPRRRARRGRKPARPRRRWRRAGLRRRD